MTSLHSEGSTDLDSGSGSGTFSIAKLCTQQPIDDTTNAIGQGHNFRRNLDPSRPLPVAWRWCHLLVGWGFVAAAAVCHHRVLFMHGRLPDRLGPTEICLPGDSVVTAKAGQIKENVCQHGMAGG